MKSHINISGVSDDWKIRQNTFAVRFQRPVSNPYYSLTEAKQQKNTGPVIYEWQLVDDKPEKSRKDEVTNVYVADWQMD
jgi:hypothetical protein